MTATTNATATRFASRTLRSVIVLVLAAAIALGTATVDRDTAEATTMTSIRSCHYHTNGYPAAHLNLQLQRWNGSDFVTIRNGRAGADGCGTWFNVPTGPFYRVQMHSVIATCNVFQGHSAWRRADTTARIQLGGSWVYHHRIC